MKQVHFGSAQLLVDGMAAANAQALIEAAIDAGATRLDTAPLYGHGNSEALVGAVAKARGAALRLPVTTKVGLEPRAAAAPWRRAAGRVWRGLPPRWRSVLRPLPDSAVLQAAGPSGRFALDAVRQSIERSLQRLQHLDRLLLHEAHPADIEPPLLELLASYQRRGDIGVLGVATGNAATLQALLRGHGVLMVAHISVDPLGPPRPATDHPALQDVVWVGHGALGAGGATLRALQRCLQRGGGMAARWASASNGTPFAGPAGPANALLARAAALPSLELLVATTKLAHVTNSIAAASGRYSLPPALTGLLDDMLASAGQELR